MTLFFVSILILAVAGVVFINPQGIESTKAGEEPVFEFKNYTFYNIDIGGVHEYLVSDHGYHYADRDIILNITYYKKSRGGVDILRSERATVQGEITDFNGSVTYSQKDGYKLISKDVRYNDKKGLIYGSNPFNVTSKSGDFNGSSFEIDVKERILRAKDFRSSFFYQ